MASAEGGTSTRGVSSAASTGLQNVQEGCGREWRKKRRDGRTGVEVALGCLHMSVHQASTAPRSNHLRQPAVGAAGAPSARLAASQCSLPLPAVVAAGRQAQAGRHRQAGRAGRSRQAGRACTALTDGCAASLGGGLSEDPECWVRLGATACSEESARDLQICAQLTWHRQAISPCPQLRGLLRQTSSRAIS